jgi:hypothetical protein
MREYWRNWGIITSLLIAVLLLLLIINLAAVWHAVLAFRAATDAWHKQHPDLAELAHLPIPLMCTAYLYRHWKSPHEGFGANYLIVAIILFGTGAFIYGAVYPSETTVVALLASCYIVAVGLYMLGCELLINGLAKRLTAERQETWTKEMDYFYLAFGAVGIIGAIGNVQGSGSFPFIERIAPLLMTISVVIRLIKTRAEVAGWNTLKFHDLPETTRLWLCRRAWSTLMMPSQLSSKSESAHSS